MNTILLVLVFFVLCLIIVCVNKIKNNTIENLEERKIEMNPKSIKEYVNQTIENAMAEQEKIALQGSVGPRGERGPAGGTFQQQGSIENIGNNNILLSREQYGITTGEKPLYTPNERWILRSDGKLQSGSGKESCLNEELNMVDCSKSSAWDYNEDLAQLRPRNFLNDSGTPQCLTLSDDNEDIILEDCEGDFSVKSRQGWMFR